jgi:hypothetical protein
LTTVLLAGDNCSQTGSGAQYVALASHPRTVAPKAGHIFALPVVRLERSLAPDSNPVCIDRRRWPARVVSSRLIGSPQRSGGCCSTGFYWGHRSTPPSEPSAISRANQNSTGENASKSGILVRSPRIDATGVSPRDLYIFAALLVASLAANGRLSRHVAMRRLIGNVDQRRELFTFFSK